MKKKEPQIFNITDFDKGEKEFLFISSLIKDGNFEEAIKSSKEAIFKYPGNSSFFILQSLAYSFSMKNNEAISILKVAEKKFPIDDQVHYQLAKIYCIMGKYVEAENHFIKSYKLIPKDDIIMRSDCLNDLGILYEKINKRDKAVEKLELALIENPNNINAQNNLGKFSDSKNPSIPKKNSANDLFLFQSLQVEKYFTNKKKKYFKNNKETQRILDIISDVWRENILPQKDKLKDMSKTEKTSWFKSIKIDFKKNISEKSTINKKDPFNNFMDDINENLSFLPPNSFLLLPFLVLFLNEAGISSVRTEEISSGKKPTEEEEDILLCSFDMATVLIDVIMEEDEDNDDDVKKQLFEDALDITSEYVPKVKGRAMILQIKDKLKEMLNMIGSFNYDE